MRKVCYATEVEGGRYLAILLGVVLLVGLWVIGPGVVFSPAPVSTPEDHTLTEPINEENGEELDLLPSVYPTEEEPVIQKVYKSAMTTKFWVGEGADESNGFIANEASYWDSMWLVHFGGIDEPECRDGFYPCEFIPKENPFYVALPYGEYEESGELKESAKQVPWYKAGSDMALLKNRWVEVVYDGKTCYGQWQDVGPFLESDFDYVFGAAKPGNTFGERAGLDISPALWDCLGLETNEVTKWRFVEATEVPEGPWTELITTSGVYWE